MRTTASPAAMARSEIVGVLLAGGQSRRMFAETTGSGDKGLLMLGDEPMISLVARRLLPQVSALVLNANGDPGRFAQLDLPVVADTVSGFPGPLAGVLAGMRWAALNRPGSRAIVTVSTDAPLLPADLVDRLSAALAVGEGRIALARSAGSLHPVIGLWPLDLADDLAAALQAGVRKVLAWTDRHGTVAVDFPLRSIGGEQVDPFFNANTPGELVELRRLIATGDPT